MVLTVWVLRQGNIVCDMMWVYSHMLVVCIDLIRLKVECIDIIINHHLTSSVESPMYG